MTPLRLGLYVLALACIAAICVTLARAQEHQARDDGSSVWSAEVGLPPHCYTNLPDHPTPTAEGESK